jgi:RimJ/RimL family protein N-acetyltransferase
MAKQCFSKAITDKRQRGDGTRAFRIFTQTLKRCNLIEEITVKVKEDNHASIAFWRRLGFEICIALMA